VKQSEKAFARTRFDNQAATNVVGAENQDEVDAISFLFSNNPRTRQYVDTSLDPSEVIHKIQLPPSTMYLIDKVVRAKALLGPIGIDNSEVINIEVEKEVQKRNRYLANLADNKGTSENQDEDDDSGEETEENN
jgi:hypothetical protein